MSSEEPSLIVPVENQLREFDPKLLLSLVAAESGFSAYFGFRTEIDDRIGRIPRGTSVSKSMTHRGRKLHEGKRIPRAAGILREAQEAK